MSEQLDVRRRRAAWRAAHRGTKEMDVLLGRFADQSLPTMSETALTHFETFMALPDPELQKWLLEAADPPATEFAGLIREIRAFHGLT
jgi:antitoxin CptB